MHEISEHQELEKCLSLMRNGTTAEQIPGPTAYLVTRIETIANGTVNYEKTGYLASPAQGYETEAGDILYSHINSVKHVGKVATVAGDQTLFHGMNLLLLRTATSTDSKYLYHFLSSTEAKAYAERECQKAINQVSLNTGQLKRLRIFHPSLPEQKKIAQILDTLDTKIQKTEALIAKLDKIKEGLLHDLLTRGIDQNGQLRPTQEQAPELYKESALGLIPKEWQINPLKAVVVSVDQGWSPACIEEPSNGDRWAVLKTSSVTWRGYNWHENKVLPSHLKPRLGYEVAPGDILITRAGPKERVGVVSWVKNTPSKLMISDKIYRLRSDCDVVMPFYLAQQLSLFRLQHQLRKTISGMADSQTNISQSTLVKLSIPVPGLGEQELVSKRIQSLNTRITSEQEIKNKLLRQKIGLMDDLLTGHTRVTPLLKDAV